MRHLIDPLDFSQQEIASLLDLADRICADPAAYQDVAAHKKLATLFYEPSTRTRLSFEAAMLNLGGHVLGFPSETVSSASKGESVADTIRVVSCYADIVAMRHPKEGAPLRASMYARVPVINAGDGGHAHPSQTMIDLMTIRQRKGRLDHLTIGFCGDLKFGRTVHSLTAALSQFEGNRFVFISPEELRIPQPEAEAVTDIESGVKAAARIGYPVLVRPSYVLGGRAMQIVSNEERLRHYLQTAVEIDVDQPVLVDRYIMGKELEVDAICDGKEVFIPGIMEHVEHTGIHSGDSISVYPTFSVSQKAKDKIIDYTVKLGLRIGIVGLYNIQFIVAGEDDVYVIEVNPRSSRTVPFLSKSTGVPMAHIATQVILGKSLREQGITEVYGREKERWYVKAPAFSFAKIRGMDSYLSPEMKSTGEAIGYDDKLTRALYKALQATGMHVSNYGTIFVTIADHDKEQALPLVKRFYDLGFNIEATTGTAEFLRAHGIRTRTRRKLNEGSNEIIEALRQGHVSYVINTIDINQHNTRLDGYEIRRTAVENNVTVFTALETVKVLLDVLEEITLRVSTIDSK